MSKPPDDQMEDFTERLRAESEAGPGKGFGRFTRLLGGGLGLARAVAKAGRTGEEGPTAKDLEKMQAIVERLGTLKGLPMKFGQIMSYLEVDLPEETRGLLSLLQTQSPATPWEKVEAILRVELGDRAEVLLAGLDRTPASIASIGQVHRACLPDGTEVAVKVRHPGIEDAIRSDFRSAHVGMLFASAVMPGMGATAKDFMGELEARLLEECDYGLEARRQALFGDLFRDHPRIVVPAFHADFSGRRVLTTTWESGAPLDTFRERATQEELDAAGAALFDFYIGTLYRHGLFHADPHPGNYLFRKDHKVVVFDYGCVRQFEPEVAAAFVALARAVQADDRERVCAALRGLGAEPSKNDAAYDHLRGLLRSFFGPLLTPGAHRIEGRLVFDTRRIMKDKMALARLRLPGRLMFLFRIRFGLFAVLSRLGAVADWAEMERGFAEQSGLGET